MYTLSGTTIEVLNGFTSKGRFRHGSACSNYSTARYASSTSSACLIRTTVIKVHYRCKHLVERQEKYWMVSLPKTSTFTTVLQQWYRSVFLLPFYRVFTSAVHLDCTVVPIRHAELVLLAHIPHPNFCNSFNVYSTVFTIITMPILFIGRQSSLFRIPYRLLCSVQILQYRWH